MAAALQQVDPDFLVQMRGARRDPRARAAALLAEARLPLLAAAMAGFGAVVSEVGAAQMVGGNIAGRDPGADHRGGARHQPRPVRAGDRLRAGPAGDRVRRQPRATLAQQRGPDRR